MRDTADMTKEMVIFPAVSSRAFPDGNFFGSTLLIARRESIKMMLLSGSKIESAIAAGIFRPFDQIHSVGYILANRDKEPDLTAAKICNADRAILAAYSSR